MVQILKTQSECFTLARGEGLTDALAEVAAAIAMAETLTYDSVKGIQYADFGRVGDLHLADAKWGGSYTGWQIRSLKAKLGTGHFRDAEWLAADPVRHGARAMKLAYQEAGNSWRPWSTYLSGAYLGFMQKAKFNEVPALPPGTYRITGGDTLSKIGSVTGFAWRLIAALNGLKSPYTIYPGQVILLPDWKYKVVSGDSLSKIALTVGHVTWQRIAEYNQMVNPNILSVGQTLKIPRYTDWDGVTLVL